MKEQELDGEDDCSSPSWSRSSQMGALNFSPSEVSRAGVCREGVGGAGVCGEGVGGAGMCGAGMCGVGGAGMYGEGVFALQL